MSKKLNLYPLKASISKGEVILQKGKDRIVCRMDGETAVKMGLEITSAGEKALKQRWEVFFVVHGHFPELIEKLDWEARKERRDWIRWIVPIEAILLGLSVTLYKPEISLHHPHPSLLKLAWAAFALSIATGVWGATAIASVREDLARDLTDADSGQEAARLDRELELHLIRKPRRVIRVCQSLCSILLAIGLGFLVLFAIWL